METSLRPTSASYEEITFLGCYLALKARKESYKSFAFEKYRHILSEVCEECGKWKNINEENLIPLGLENEFNNSRIENLINESGNEFIYASTGKIYDLGSKEIIPRENSRYFFLVTVCLNNFNDDNVENLLLHQLSIYPDKAEFLKKLKLNIRDHAGEIIPESKSKTVLEWITENVNQISNRENISANLSSVEQVEIKAKSPIPPPKGFRKISGKLSDEEIKRFFSFLYEEKGKDGNPYLPQDDVEDLLQYGFGTGDEPSGKYFNLNINLRQKILIKYCFYKLIRSHEIGGTSTRDEVFKFLIFNFEQFKPESGKDYSEHFDIFIKNFTGVPPAKKMSFNILTYLP